MIATPVQLTQTCGALRLGLPEHVRYSRHASCHRSNQRRSGICEVDPSWGGVVAILDRQLTPARAGFKAISNDYEGFQEDDFGNQG